MPLFWQHSDPKVKALDKDFRARKFSNVGKNSARKRSSFQSTSSSKLPKGLKSFSHELGPKGGIRPVQLRAHSFNDLKVWFQLLISITFWFFLVVYTIGNRRGQYWFRRIRFSWLAVSIYKNEASKYELNK